MARRRPSTRDVEEVYVLGAGASYVHGAPLTDDLLRYALSIRQARPETALVRRFLEQVFHFVAPATLNNSSWTQVPSLVDILSIVDVALDRKESLAPGFDMQRLREVRGALEYCVFRALEDALRYRPRRDRGRRSRAMQQLADSLDPRAAAVISFNYDVIADIALARHGSGFDFDSANAEAAARANAHALDYGVDFVNVEPRPNDGSRFRLLKLHGSFNWLQSRLTGDLYFGGLQKAAGVVFETNRERAAANLHQFFGTRFRQGGSGSVLRDLEMVIVTPTHLKDLRSPHLARIWRRAEECLRSARRVTFIGYSLPGDDLHVKYLLKRAIATRPAGELPRIVVVNKGSYKTSQVRLSYERFFGKRLVEYHGEGFDRWVRTRES